MKGIAIVLLFTFLVLPASASRIDSLEGSNANYSDLTWDPQIVDYVYVNATINRTITYSVTAAEPMILDSWILDGTPVTGVSGGNTVSYTHTWNNESVGFHSIIYQGMGIRSYIAFRWYVNVYEIDHYNGGNLLDAIDDALDSQALDIKVRLMKNTIAKYGNKSNITVLRINQLQDEIIKQQNFSKELGVEFKKGNISIDTYVPSLKQAQRDTKYSMKLAGAMAKIAKEDLNDEKLALEFNKIQESGSGSGGGSSANTAGGSSANTAGGSSANTAGGSSANSGGGGNSANSGGGGNSANSGGGGNSANSGGGGNSANSGGGGNSANSGGGGNSANSGGGGNSAN
ncbi:MAG: hypothetical protein O8C65_07525, partial [Candidatus Methanoperedens sp.]|nr:hypothetical protein [Candidatus Methanoperedens sp.]